MTMTLRGDEIKTVYRASRTMLADMYAREKRAKTEMTHPVRRGRGKDKTTEEHKTITMQDA